MYIHQMAHYLPEKRVSNEYFNQLNGLSNEWIIERTGIEERRKAAEHENTNTLTLDAIKALQNKLPDLEKTVDLIIGATYTPFDTIYTLAHAAQRYLNIGDIPVVSISTACSSLINAFEIVEGYFATNKASKALVVAAEHNTRYSDENDKVAGHLWGDGAVAFYVSKEQLATTDLKVLEIKTKGAANVGKADESVILQPVDAGFKMPFGRDVFQQACIHMAEITEYIVKNNNIGVQDIRFLVPHQANNRITKNVAKQLGLHKKNALSNIEYLGNTGCAGCGILLSEHEAKINAGEYVVMTVFGGGYSCGAMLLQKQGDLTN